MLVLFFFYSTILLQTLYFIYQEVFFSLLSKIWCDNFPHAMIVEHKDQTWVYKFGDYLVFHKGGTQFKEAVISYLEFIKKEHHFMTLPAYEPCQLNVFVSISSPCSFFLNRNRLERR